MAKKPVKYCLVDAFTDREFKGNPAAVFVLEDAKDDEWLQAVAREFSLPITCYLTRIMDSESGHTIPRFQLRWFTTVTEVKLCGHGTLAAAYYLFTHGINSDEIEFLTLSGSLITKKVPETEISTSVNHQNGDAQKEGFFIQLDFPVIPIAEFKSADILAISKSLNGASVVEIQKTTDTDDILVVLPSGKDVVKVEPQFDQIRECPGRAMVVTGPAPPGSGFDFYSRVFGPKMGVNEDPVCGSLHCALAPYWCKKLGKFDFKAYSASPRSGVINLHLDPKNQKVILRGTAVLVAEGSLLV